MQGLHPTKELECFAALISSLLVLHESLLDSSHQPDPWIDCQATFCTAAEPCGDYKLQEGFLLSECWSGNQSVGDDQNTAT